MGGGDLNLKKSWHPHTMKNQEKVWKAEQAKTQEEKKLTDLRKEIEREKNCEDLKRIGRENGVLECSNNADNKKLDWMYKNSSELINREQYLLGRKVDKSFEVLQQEEKEQQSIVGVKQPLNHVEHECVPFSIRSYKNLDNTEQVDLQRKVMEDPLMLIKQREIESRRKILENPVKLKELHRILKTDEKLRKISKKIKKSKRSKKSKKKHKKRKCQSTSSSCSDSDTDTDLDSKLAKKLKGGLLNNEDASSLGINLVKLLDSKFEKISQELDKAVGNNKKRCRKNKTKSDESETNSCADQEKNYKSRRYRSTEHKKFSSKDRRSRSVSRHSDKRLNKYEQSDRKKNHRFRNASRSKGNKSSRESRSVSKNKEQKTRKAYRSRSRSKSKEKKSRKPHRSRSRSRGREIRNLSQSTISLKDDRSTSKAIDRKRSYRSRSKSPAQTSSQSKHNRPQKYEKPTLSTKHASHKLTEEEKQAKLREMMSNAAWREEERTEIVRKHREAYAREEERHTTREFDKDFLNKEVKKAMANQTSVGSRLRANLNNIQRTSAAMNSNFARK